MIRGHTSFIVSALAGSVVLVTATGCGAAQPADAPVSRIVRDTPSLFAALRSARPGDTILLEPGEYTTALIDGVKFSREVRVVSKDASQRAVIRGLKVNNASGLTFRDLNILWEAKWNYAFVSTGSSNIRLEDSELHGKRGIGTGIGVWTTNDFAVLDSHVHGFHTGALFQQTDRVLIGGNRFSDLQSDGIKSSMNTNITISGNYFTNFYPEPGDHPDAIQFFKRSPTDTQKNIVVTDNTFVRGQGGGVQGIFIGNENKVAYENVTVTGNAIIGGWWHGVSVDRAVNVNVSNNIVQGHRDMAGSWVGVYNSNGGLVADNQATAFNLHTNMGLTERANRKLQPTRQGDVSILARIGRQVPDDRAN